MKKSRLCASTLIVSLGAIAIFAAAQAQEKGNAATVPDFSGVWARANFPDSVDERIDAKKFPRVRYGSMFFPVPGDNAGKPVAFLEGNNPDEVVGDYNSPILQPWVQAIVKKNAESELQDRYVPTAHGTCWPSGVPEVLNLREPVELLQQKGHFLVGLGAAHEEKFTAVGGGDPHIEQLDRREFFEDGARHHSTGERAQVLAQGDRQAVGEKRHE